MGLSPRGTNTSLPKRSFAGFLEFPTSVLFSTARRRVFASPSQIVQDAPKASWRARTSFEEGVLFDITTSVHTLSYAYHKNHKRQGKKWQLLMYLLRNRFQPRSTPASQRRRKQLLVRIALIASVALVIFYFIWPGASIFPILSLGFLSGSEDLQLETVRYYDLSNVQGTARGWEREERILLCAPLRDAESHLRMFFSHLRNFTYPHHLIDLAFLVSDSKDQTLPLLSKLLEDLQADEDPKQPYGEISIIEKDFGQKVNQDVESRHGFAAQASRRKLMAQARNWLLSAALRPYHSWVYWRDVDVETAPFTILEDLMRHNKDVIVPSKSSGQLMRLEMC